MNQQYDKAFKAAETLAKSLVSQGMKIVFAESCTAGMASAMLATVPGISSVLCGSAVTYREPTKVSWLNVSPELFATHTAESKQVTIAMARRVLEITPEAKLAAAITGHLGPGVDENVDGRVFIVVLKRGAEAEVCATEVKLMSDRRCERQVEAAGILLEQVKLFLACD